MSFTELGLAPNILRRGRRRLHAAYADPIGSHSARHARSRFIGLRQTGTGKTAAFALPILHRLSAEKPQGRRKIRVLVLSPTRELAAQIGDSFRVYGRHTGLRHTVVYGGVGQHPQVKALQSGVEILVATPGRLCDLMNQGYIDLSGVEIFVLDEADRMLDMGFLPDLRKVIAKLPGARQTLFFSATMPAEIERLANAILRNPVQVRIAPVKETTELIVHSVYLVPKEHKPDLLENYLNQEAITRAIVFTRTKHGADRVTRRLNKAGIQAEAMHGDKSQAARQRTLANFKGSRTQILVATDVAARGIDVDNVSHVLNYDLPQEAETYLHRIGRTGRAGATGIAVSFCEQGERGQLRAIERLIRQQLTVVRGPAFEGKPQASEGRASEEPRNGDTSDAPPKRYREAPAPHAPRPKRFGSAQSSGSTNRPRKSGTTYPSRAERRRAAAPRS